MQATKEADKENIPATNKDVSPIVKEKEGIVNIDNWLATREEFIKKVSSQMKEGKDYHVIQDRKSLAKGGAEKIASIFKWTAEFVKDTETLEMLANSKGVLAYICNLKNGDFVGQGRGAREVAKDKGDVNKSIKMAQKSAFIDAVLRASGLSDIFTQDLEDMKDTANDWKASDKQMKFIKDLMAQKGVENLGDLGFTKPASWTSQIASEIIETLQALPAKSAIEQEAVLSDKQLEEIGK